MLVRWRELPRRHAAIRRGGLPPRLTKARLAAFLLGIATALSAQTQSPPKPSLADASLEDLMNVEVVSVTRKEQTLSKTGAAVFVITQQDIKRSGAANIPDILRMAPGVNVARIDANAWAISIRGFNSRYSDKVLLLIDGRSVYSPAFSGVYWEQIDVPLEDIDRIEIIRGPGGTAWGANAVNGVINIITMSAKAAPGALLVAGAGSQQSGSLAQYGGAAGSSGAYRAFGGYSNTSSSLAPGGESAADGWHQFHGGFRADVDLSPRDQLMVQGDISESAEGQTLTTVLANQLPTIATFNDAITADTDDLQARWSHTLQKGSEMSLNVYYNHVNRLDQGLRDTSNTFDIDFQHHIKVHSGNDIVWGLGYRATGDNLTSGYDTQFLPHQRTDNLYSIFFQDEIQLAKSAWFTIGAKMEHNAYTGFELEPSAQLVWAPSSRHTVWLSASQAVRQPSRQDTDLQFDASTLPLPGGGFGLVKVIGNPDSQAERLREYQAGYRSQVTKRLSLDLAAFRGYYRHLESSEPGIPYLVNTPAAAYEVFPIEIKNGARATSYGGEIFGTWAVTGRWRISPAYSFLHMNLTQDPLSPTAAGTLPLSAAAPIHQLSVRSTLELRSNLDWDTSLYLVGRLTDPQVPEYTRLDTQIRWHVRESVEFSVGGQNLLTARHMEFGNAISVDYTQVQRSVLGKVTWRF